MRIDRITQVLRFNARKNNMVTRLYQPALLESYSLYQNVVRHGEFKEAKWREFESRLNNEFIILESLISDGVLINEMPCICSNEIAYMEAFLATKERSMQRLV